MVRSFFNPSWKDLGVLASYGRWLGVNWVWAEWLTIFHSIFSITIPIFLVELTYPQTRSKIWLSSRSRILFHGLLVLSIVLGFFAFPYNASALAIAGCVLSVIILGWTAKRIPNINPLNRTLKVSWKVLVPIGASVPAVFFFLFNSALIPLPIGTMIVGALMVLGYERLLARWAKIGFNNMQKLGLITGAIGFWALFFDSILELIGRLGTSILGLAFVAYLMFLRKRTARGLIAIPSSNVEPELPNPTEPGPR
jgi:hypothetical protein